jgi:hypothetical protein
VFENTAFRVPGIWISIEKIYGFELSILPLLTLVIAGSDAYNASRWLSYSSSMGPGVVMEKNTLEDFWRTNQQGREG